MIFFLTVIHKALWFKHCGGCVGLFLRQVSRSEYTLELLSGGRQLDYPSASDRESILSQKRLVRCW